MIQSPGSTATDQWRRGRGIRGGQVTRMLEFAFRGASAKIFNTKSKDVVCQCMEMFRIRGVHDAKKRTVKFIHNAMSSTNALYKMCREYAQNELQVL